MPKITETPTAHPTTPVVPSLGGEVEASGPRQLTGTVVLDTSVLVDDPEALFAFDDAHVVVPLIVVEELDGLKLRSDEVGWAARQAVRNLEALRVRAGGALSTPVPLAGGGSVRVETNGVHKDKVAKFGLDVSRPDNRILAASLTLAENASGAAVTVVSNDAALRIKAAQLGLAAAEYAPNPSADDTDPGWVSVDVSPQLVDRLHADGSLALEQLAAFTDVAALYANRGVLVRAGKQSAAARVKQGRVVRLRTDREAWGLNPHSFEQRLALDLLLDPDVAVVALRGRAGTGKTILALAAALEQVLNDTTADRIGVYRPVIPVGKETDLGFLPGSLEEKLAPWMAAISDNLAALSSGSEQLPPTPPARGGKPAKPAQPDLLEELRDRGKLELGSVAHIRGRSIGRSILIIDEAQSLSVSVGKALLTRVAEGTRVVLTGDLDQIDSAYLSRANNALSAVIGAFRGQECFGHVLLTRQERSDVAELAARLL